MHPKEDGTILPGQDVLRLLPHCGHGRPNLVRHFFSSSDPSTAAMQDFEEGGRKGFFRKKRQST